MAAWNELVERPAELLHLDAALAAVSGTRLGRLLVIGGEAGSGRRRSYGRSANGHGDGRAGSSGAPAMRHTPRPLGPLVDIAEETGGEPAELAHAGMAPGAFVAALARELRAAAPAIVVLEDCTGPTRRR